MKVAAKIITVGGVIALVGVAIAATFGTPVVLLAGLGVTLASIPVSVIGFLILISFPRFMRGELVAAQESTRRILEAQRKHLEDVPAIMLKARADATEGMRKRFVDSPPALRRIGEELQQQTASSTEVVDALAQRHAGGLKRQIVEGEQRQVALERILARI